MSQLGKKRPVEDFIDVSSIEHSSPNAKVCGVVLSLSPMKKSKTSDYFDGRLCDGKRSIRLFGFDRAMQKKLEAYQGKSDAVELTNCEIKQREKCEDFEVQVKSFTTVETSAAKFEFDLTAAVKKTEEIAVSQVGGKARFQRVTLAVKAIRIDDLEEIKGKKKQDILVGDCTGAIRFTVWEDEVGKLVEGRLNGVTVREYLGERFISTAKENCVIERIDDIGDVDEETFERRESGSNYRERMHKVEDAKVAGVVPLESYGGCLKCGAKVYCEGEFGGRCGKCGMLQQMSFCKKQWTAQMVIVAGDVQLTLRAFGKVVADIADKDVTDEALLGAQPFSLMYSEGKVIQSIKRST